MKQITIFIVALFISVISFANKGNVASKLNKRETKRITYTITKQNVPLPVPFISMVYAGLWTDGQGDVLGTVYALYVGDTAYGAIYVPSGNSPTSAVAAS